METPIPAQSFITSEAPEVKKILSIEEIEKKSWLTADELSLLIDMSVHSIREKVQGKEIPFYRAPGTRRPRFKRKEIDEWVESGK